MILGVLIGLWFGTPVLPVLAVGALAQAAPAFTLTRDVAAVRPAIGAVLAVAISVLVPVLFGQSPPVPQVWFERLAEAGCAISLLSSTIVGVVGQSRSPAAALLAVSRRSASGA